MKQLPRIFRWLRGSNRRIVTAAYNDLLFRDPSEEELNRHLDDRIVRINDADFRACIREGPEVRKIIEPLQREIPFS